MNMDQIIIDNLWLPLILWVLMYTADYYLTIAGAKLYKKNGKSVFDIEGSYEITPVYQNDIDKLKMVSPLFLKSLFISSMLLSGVWFISHMDRRYELMVLFLFGSMFFLEVVVLLRHIRNIITYTTLPSGVVYP